MTDSTPELPTRYKPGSMPSRCYLCGQILDPKSQKISKDHCPPKQFIAPDLRKLHNPSKLDLIPVHAECNESYHSDEDYFVHTLIPFLRGSYAGDALYRKTISDYKSGKGRSLIRRVLAEFDHRPGGVILPAGLVAKRFNPMRFERIAWKLVRGVRFLEAGELYPAEQLIRVEWWHPDKEPPEHFKLFVALPGNEPKGIYEGVFSYRYKEFASDHDEPGPNTRYFAMLLWDRIIVTVFFHEPDCRCQDCAQPS